MKMGKYLLALSLNLASYAGFSYSVRSFYQDPLSNCYQNASLVSPILTTLNSDNKVVITATPRTGDRVSAWWTSVNWRPDNPYYWYRHRKQFSVDGSTSITIPYDELGLIEVMMPDGSRLAIIENGRFVLPGTEELNKPFEA